MHPVVFYGCKLATSIVSPQELSFRSDITLKAENKFEVRDLFRLMIISYWNIQLKICGNRIRPT